MLKRIFNKNTKVSTMVQRYTGFTIAEILIVLGIIGIIAELTIPTLINDYKEQAYKVAYKRAFSIASQSWMRALNDGNISPRTTWEDGATRESNFNAFKANFKVALDCNNNDNSKCWKSGEWFYSSPNLPDESALAFIDNSGMAWSTTAGGSSNSYGANILVDTNGHKSPNKYGQDRFILNPLAADGSITGLPVKIYPYGDCLSTTDCVTYSGLAVSYVDVCPSVASHPCYYKSWLYN